MISIVPDVLCTAIAKPREWEMDGRSGISYKVDVSDGEDNITFACDGPDVHAAFEPFKHFQITLDTKQTNFDGRKGTKTQIIDAQPAKG